MYRFTLSSGATLIMSDCFIVGDSVVGKLSNGEPYRLMDSDYIDCHRLA